MRNLQEEEFMKKDSWVDLHVHTNCSDGLLTPGQVVEKAKEAGMSAVGISDHDTADGLPEAFEVGVKVGVEVVPGVELSSQFRKRDLHVLGYYFDSENERLKKHLKLFRDERFRRAERMVQKLQEIGVGIEIEEVAKKSTGCSIGRPHIAEVLMEKGYVETFQDAFKRYIGYGAKAYVEKYKISPQEAIALIAEARGLSFLAHPGPIVNDNMIFDLIKAGLDGIEVIHPNLSSNRTEYLQQIARTHGLLVSGGSDCHGGREGLYQLGDHCVPYAIVEQMKNALRSRWGEKTVEKQLKGSPLATEAHSGH